MIEKRSWSTSVLSFHRRGVYAAKQRPYSPYVSSALFSCVLISPCEVLPPPPSPPPGCNGGQTRYDNDYSQRFLGRGGRTRRIKFTIFSQSDFRVFVTKTRISIRENRLERLYFSPPPPMRLWRRRRRIRRRPSRFRASQPALCLTGPNGRFSRGQRGDTPAFSERKRHRPGMNGVKLSPRNNLVKYERGPAVTLRLRGGGGVVKCFSSGRRTKRLKAGRNT